MMAASYAWDRALSIQDAKFKSLGLERLVMENERVCGYMCRLGNASPSNPILVLLHGYPESSYCWRHVVPLLPSTAPIFAADLPGYGGSAPIEQDDKLACGRAIMAALKQEVRASQGPQSDAQASISVVFIGHDRGARMAHRLAVSETGGINVLGVCLIDIVPTLTQWRSSAHAPESVGFFHWPFLANVSLATRMIASFGRGAFCKEMTYRWAGSNKAGLEALKSDDAVEKVYAGFMERASVVEAGCRDYAAGAGVDVDAQREDQQKGKKLKAPVSLLYSEGYLGKRYDVPKEWADWIEDRVSTRAFAVGDGVGHFVPEEAPEKTVEAINWLLRSLY